MDFSGTTTCNETLVLNKRLNGVDTIIDCTLSVLEERVCGSTEDDCCEFILVLISAEDGHLSG